MPASFTPVTQESFKKWCDEFKDHMRKIKEELKSEMDDKLTGRQIFETKKGVVDEINLDEEEEETEEDFKEDGEDDDEDEDAFYYDKGLYDQN